MWSLLSLLIQPGILLNLIKNKQIDKQTKTTFYAGITHAILSDQNPSHWEIFHSALHIIPIGLSLIDFCLPDQRVSMCVKKYFLSGDTCKLSQLNLKYQMEVIWRDGVKITKTKIFRTVGSFSPKGLISLFFLCFCEEYRIH